MSQCELSHFPSLHLLSGAPQEKRQKRLVLSGEVISNVQSLRAALVEKLGMQSTNVRKSFRRLDTDYSGALDRKEFRRFLESMNIVVTEGCYNDLFDMLDLDKNGTVEFE